MASTHLHRHHADDAVLIRSWAAVSIITAITGRHLFDNSCWLEIIMSDLIAGISRAICARHRQSEATLSCHARILFSVLIMASTLKLNRAMPTSGRQIATRHLSPTAHAIIGIIYFTWRKRPIDDQHFRSVRARARRANRRRAELFLLAVERDDSA